MIGVPFLGASYRKYPTQNDEFMTDLSPLELLHGAVRQAQKDWLSAFDACDAKACAALYEPDAEIHVKQIGTFKGKKEIQAFWQGIIDAGFRDYEPLDPELTIVDDKSVIVSMTWRMNKIFGKLSKSLWILQPDNSILIRELEYEIYAERIDQAAGESVADIFERLRKQSEGQSNQAANNDVINVPDVEKASRKRTYDRRRLGKLMLPFMAADRREEGRNSIGKVFDSRRLPSSYWAKMTPL